MKRRIRLTEGDIHKIVKQSVNRVLNEGSEFYNKGYSKGGGNGVVTDALGVTYDMVSDVYYALYGHGSDNHTEETVDDWWNQILSNARKENRDYHEDYPSRKMQLAKNRNNRKHGLGDW